MIADDEDHTAAGPGQLRARPMFSAQAANAARNASLGSVPSRRRLIGEHRQGQPSALVLGQGDVDVESEVGVADTSSSIDSGGG